ncbi:hypothetical protein GUJ93_ZPchr0005g16048 [Zizania palustris]|uniref:Uncharacterized protein n=1 Tax=Zizania palustris TaxID=103762 RepID=A0A8J5VGG7_ZIZPA|nr:hypothetical protein GUJ93_ZPchr0005g16048 [Zizania palustris]
MLRVLQQTRMVSQEVHRALCWLWSNRIVSCLLDQHVQGIDQHLRLINEGIMENIIKSFLKIDPRTLGLLGDLPVYGWLRQLVPMDKTRSSHVEGLETQSLVVLYVVLYLRPLIIGQCFHSDQDDVIVVNFTRHG